MGSNSRSADQELRQFVERVERLNQEAKDVADQKKEVMAEAKARGFDTKVMNKLIAERKREPDDVAEEEAILDMYREALGMRTSLSYTDPPDDSDGDEPSDLV